jgi:hypothetical protein
VVSLSLSLYLYLSISLSLSLSRGCVGLVHVLLHSLFPVFLNLLFPMEIRDSSYGEKGHVGHFLTCVVSFALSFLQVGHVHNM